MKNLSTKVLALCAILLLAACSGEPSEGALRKAVEKDFEKSGQAFNGKLGRSKLYELDKLACRESKDAPGYVCDIRIDAELPILGRSNRQLTVRMVKSDGEWTLMNVSGAS